MISFYTFRLVVNTAFKGEPANIVVSKFGERWSVKASSKDEKTSVTAETNADEMTSTAHCRVFAVQLFKALVKHYNEDEIREASTTH